MKKLSEKVVFYILLISILLILITSIYFWNNRSHMSSFFLNRLSELLTYQDSKHYDPLHSFREIPLAPYLILPLSKVLNLEIIDVAYLPIIPFLSFFSLLMFGKVISNFPKNRYYIFVSFSVFIQYFVIAIPFTEYYIGISLYPIFLWAFLKYLNNRKASFTFILILLFIGIHFLSPPMSTWNIIFMTIFAIFISIAKKQKKVNTNFPFNLFIIWVITICYIPTSSTIRNHT